MAKKPESNPDFQRELKEHHKIKISDVKMLWE